MQMDNTKTKKRSSGKEQYTLGWKLDNSIEFSPRQQRAKRRDTNPSWFYLGLVGDIGLTVALPIVGGALLGSYIDRQTSTYPKATLSLLFIGIVIASLGFVSIMREVLNRNH